MEAWLWAGSITVATEPDRSAGRLRSSITTAHLSLKVMAGYIQAGVFWFHALPGLQADDARPARARVEKLQGDAMETLFIRTDPRGMIFHPWAFRHEEQVNTAKNIFKVYAAKMPAEAKDYL